MDTLQAPIETAAPDRVETMVVELGYRGGAYSGFAEQKDPAIRTVAGELRHALELILRREVELTCAGRTDAGVHALAQYVSLPVYGEECDREGRRIVHALVGITPDDISIRGLYRAEASFSARFDALRRHYRYRIALGETAPIMAQGTSWWFRQVNELDVAAMHEAAQLLLGERDFKSFCKASSAEGISTMRCLEQLDVHRIEEAGENLIAFDVCANAFLHNMVRTLVGTLVEVGRGVHGPAWVLDVLEARDRRAAGQSAPAEGLVLAAVDYPAGALVPWDGGRA
ncbi:MAG: tRNA pseudouridine(38-40) synthase TruA [Atopobiaceae bacterium]|nr:tRNA pseudouridine(38-40) synthase TruA [Atopobiaceae bacterium]